MRRSIMAGAVVLALFEIAALTMAIVLAADSRYADTRGAIPTPIVSAESAWIESEPTAAPLLSVGYDAPSTPASGPAAECFTEDAAETVTFWAASKPEEEKLYIEVAAVPKGTRTSLGIFTVTAYCDCPKCCGKWSGHKMSIPTQAGVPYPVEGYTISVDPKVIPLKSVVELDGYGTRYAHDTGSGIKGNRIDMFFASHQDALAFGRQELEVWIYE